MMFLYPVGVGGTTGGQPTGVPGELLACFSPLILEYGREGAKLSSNGAYAHPCRCALSQMPIDPRDRCVDDPVVTIYSMCNETRAKDHLRLESRMRLMLLEQDPQM